MTLPINYKFPEINKDATPEEISLHLHDLTFELQNMYELMAQNINGSFRSNDYVDGSAWKPTVRGATNAGTITYLQQSGWVIRYGIITEIWFQVEWSTIGAASGWLLLDLPYKVTQYDSDMGNLFIGPLMSGGPTGLSYPVGKTFAVISALPGTFTAKVQSGQSGAPSSEVSINSNSYISGNVRYIGVEDE